jgi:Holliday junction resolvase RusA-like endonuclease
MWKNYFIIEIFGEPVPTARARFNGKTAYTPQKTKLAMTRRVILMKNAIGHQSLSTLNEPIRVELEFHHSRPKRLLAKKYKDSVIPKTTKPDVDNLAKLMLDCATKSKLWSDDNLICELEVKDYYCSRQSNAKSVMIVKTMTTD